MTMCHFWAQNTPICPEQIYLEQTIIVTFIYLLALFTEQNLKKNSYSWSRVVRMHHFWAKNILLAPNKTFFWKIINITLIYILAPFFMQNLKKFPPADPELRGCAIFGTKMAHFPKWEFFSENLLISLIFFIHAYLHAKSGIYLLVKYWRLKNTKIS